MRYRFIANVASKGDVPGLGTRSQADVGHGLVMFGGDDDGIGMTAFFACVRNGTGRCAGGGDGNGIPVGVTFGRVLIAAYVAIT